MRFLVRVTLENEGHDVIEAHHGAAALKLFQESAPDLVITDLMMPVMGGRELIDRLRSDPLTASIPIVILSANADVRVGDADAALEKPFDINVLVETLTALTTKGGTS